MIAILLLLAHSGLASGVLADASGPCRCSSGRQQVRYGTTLHSRDIKDSLEIEQDKAEQMAVIRSVFTLSFCGKTPEEISARHDGSLGWPSIGCTADRRGERPWPELVRVSCSGIPNFTTLPSGFRMDEPVRWSEHGEELNRFWTAEVLVSRECSGN